ncbi:MAG TPA: hypothetical protein VII98_08035 [Solirubrobacteraceae bacterium]
MHRVEREVRPPWPFRLPRAGPDGVARRVGAVLERLVHVDGRPVHVRVAQPQAARVVLVAEAEAPDLAAEAIVRMRFALALDDDLRPFHDAFRDDPLIGRSVRTRPELRISRRPEPFEALAWAICEQLIEFREALGIERRMLDRMGRACRRCGLRDLPAPQALADAAPAELEALGLSAGRALALRRAAREVACGRVDLDAADHERGWKRLRAIPGIGQWTVDVLALHGQGRMDRLPAGDLAYLRFAGRHLLGNPRARATEQEVRELFEPYGRWAGLAGAHALGAVPGGGTLRATPPAGLSLPPSRRPARRPARAGTRSSAPGPRWRAA